MGRKRIVQGLLLLLAAILLVEIYRSPSWGLGTIRDVRASVASLGSLGLSMLVLGAFLGTLLLFPLSPLGFLAGLLYGFLPAVGALMVGGLLAAIVGFFAVRRGFALRFAEWVGEHIPPGARPRFRKEQNWVLVVFLLRAVPIMPYGSASYILAFTRVPILDYVVGSALGLAPVAILSAWLGSRAVLIDSPAELLRPDVWAPALLLVALFAVGFAFQSRWHGRKRQNPRVHG